MTAVVRTIEDVDPQALRPSFRGELLGHEDPGYEEARRVWNGSIDRRPALIARCTGTADVLAAVRFARERDVLVAVRGGGHNIAGLGTCDDGLLIDCTPMKGIHVDPARRIARAQPGLVWGDVDHETQAFGLAVPGGVLSTTGIAGFTLGGGFGWLSRKFALACDNLESVDLVTADGEVLTVTAEIEPELLWGLKGGGGNFGIVTSFEYRLHQVGPEVLAGSIVHPMERAPAVLRFLRDFLDGAPDELFTIAILRQAPPSPLLPAEIHGRHVLMLGFCWCGDLDEGVRVLEPLRRHSEPLADIVEPRRYTTWQAAMDGAWTAGFQNYWKAEYLAGLSDGAIDVLVDAGLAITSPLSDMKIGRMGGAIEKVSADGSSFGHRGAPYLLNINARWEDPAQAERHVSWTRELWSAVQPFSAGGVYVNFLGDEGADRVRAAYDGPTFDRLVALKRRWDPDNFFRVNQNIPPD